MSVLQCVRQYRLVSLSFIVFCCLLAYQITAWFMGVDAPNNAQGAFASATVLALIGIGKYWMETNANDSDQS